MKIPKITFLKTCCIAFSLFSANVSAALLTYTFDDGTKSQLNAVDILGKFNQQGVIGPIARVYEGFMNDRHKLTLEDLRYFSQQGWEVASHSYSHRSLTRIPLTYNDEVVSGWAPLQGSSNVYTASYNYGELTALLQKDSYLKKVKSLDEINSRPGSYFFDKDGGILYVNPEEGIDPLTHEIRAGSAERELEYSKEIFENEGFEINSFVAPFNRWSDDLATLAEKYYDTAVIGKGLTWPNKLPLESNYFLKRIGINGNISMEEIEARVEEAILNNEWLILTFHKIEDCKDKTTCSSDWSAKDLEKFASWVSTQDIDVVTLKEGVAIAAVPIPASVLMFLSGLGFIAFYSKYNRTWVASTRLKKVA